jgi:succinoglycan biosynthesis protein ExoA
VSILMPTRNEAAFIERSLGAVLAQDYPHDRMEVLVADGMSTDSTREIVLRMQASSDVPVTIVDNKGRIAPAGLNAALRRARGDVIVRVDGHCRIARDYVARCVECLRDRGVAGVGGPIETIGDNSVSEAIAFAMSSTFGVGGSAFRTIKDREILVDTVAFPAYTRQALELAGPFDEELIRNQDDEYNYRLRELGGEILLSPKIRSQYFSRNSIRSLWRQYYQYGFWKVRVMQKHHRQMRPRQFVPPAFTAILSASALLATFSLIGRWVLSLVCAAYLITNLRATLWLAIKHGWRFLPLLPLVFATLHLSYGFGFLSGLLVFWNRWGDKGTRVYASNLPT